ncbi:MAG: hypothetical protein PHH39_09205, partial [Methanothrix soehngenii]|nr:hypothetical protein [Methanothrix soehngenii]
MAYANPIASSANIINYEIIFKKHKFTSVFASNISRGLLSLGMDEIKEIRSRIKGMNLTWTAGETAVSE